MCFLLTHISSYCTIPTHQWLQTFVNNVRIKRETPLEQHDTVRFGTDLSTYRIEYQLDARV